MAKTKMSGFFGQELFGKNAKVRIFWSPDFKQTTVLIFILKKAFYFNKIDQAQQAASVSRRINSYQFVSIRIVVTKVIKRSLIKPKQNELNLEFVDYKYF